MKNFSCRHRHIGLWGRVLPRRRIFRVAPKRCRPKAVVYMDTAYNWTGAYVGLNGGWRLGRSISSRRRGRLLDTSGGLIGGTLGYNYQVGQAVLASKATSTGATLTAARLARRLELLNS